MGSEGKILAVVLPVYSGDSATSFKLAVESLFCQTVPACEIIIVVDGPVSSDLDNQLYQYSVHENIIVKRLPENVGRGAARHAGIQISSSKFIAIMDADDICVSSRFEKQLKLLRDNQVDFVGGLIEEVEKENVEHTRLRVVPEKNEDIFCLGKWRQPVNHVSLVFSKKKYDEVGGYRNLKFLEDFDFIMRALARGMIFHNLAEVLVKVSFSITKRKFSLGFLIEEWNVLYLAYRIGYLSLFNLIVGFMARFCIRLCPGLFLRYIYKIFFRSSAHI